MGQDGRPAEDTALARMWRFVPRVSVCNGFLLQELETHCFSVCPSTPGSRTRIWSGRGGTTTEHSRGHRSQGFQEWLSCVCHVRI